MPRSGRIAGGGGGALGQALIVAAVLLVCVTTLYPFLYVVSASVSDPAAITENRVYALPVAPLNLEAYRLILADRRIWVGYANTVYYAVIGTAINLVMTVLAAYPLSRRGFSGRRAMNVFISLTMFISATGVMIPLFLLVKRLGMYNTRLSILLVFAATPFYIILLRSFFETVPEELVEAAKIDGASEFTVLWRVVLPVSGAALATIGLYYFINRWNGYFWAMVFLKDQDKLPLQVVLRQLILVAEMGETLNQDILRSTTTAEAVKYGTIVIATLPIAIIYPFVQKYFVKGVTLGAMKE